MVIKVQSNISPAAWIMESNTSPTQMAFFGPDCFDSYVRLRYIPDPTYADHAEADTELSGDHNSDLWQAQRALRWLAQHTSTPNDCYSCLWEGDPDLTLPDYLTDDSLVTIPHRRYVLLNSSLDDLADWGQALNVHGSKSPPAFVWPADHSWIFASDVDPHWAGIGGTAAATSSLLSDTRLDVVYANPADTQPLYG